AFEVDVLVAAVHPELQHVRKWLPRNTGDRVDTSHDDGVVVGAGVGQGEGPSDAGRFVLARNHRAYSAIAPRRIFDDQVVGETAIEDRQVTRALQLHPGEGSLVATNTHAERRRMLVLEDRGAEVLYATPLRSNAVAEVDGRASRPVLLPLELHRHTDLSHVEAVTRIDVTLVLSIAKPGHDART